MECKSIDDLYQIHPPLKQAETQADHRLESRDELLSLIPIGKCGAELGVFTGMFSERLLAKTQPKKLYLVDVWHTVFNPNFPDWGLYTAHGTLSASMALEAVKTRTRDNPVAEIIIRPSVEWMRGLATDSLDWVYIDSSHSYDGTLEELTEAARVIAKDGLILGDDAWIDPNSHHFGVFKAVRDFCRENPWEIIHLDVAAQWAIRRWTD